MVPPQVEESEEIFQQEVEMAIARREGLVWLDFVFEDARRPSCLS
jgi:hypothetical protein